VLSRVLLAVSLGGLIASVGCASAQATGKPSDRPALIVPAPPPRIIEPAIEPPPPEPVAELPPPPSSAPPRTSRPPAPKPAATEARAEAKPGEAKPGEQKPVDLPPVDPPPPVSPSAQLRTPQTSDTSAAAKNVRVTIDTASGLLNTVDYAPLSNVRKKAYNDAKLFMKQAEDALKQGNLVFAQAVANKAETLAKELAGR
jgi:hypothetical protein